MTAGRRIGRTRPYDGEKGPGRQPAPFCRASRKFRFPRGIRLTRCTVTEFLPVPFAPIRSHSPPFAPIRPSAVILIRIELSHPTQCKSPSPGANEPRIYRSDGDVGTPGLSAPPNHHRDRRISPFYIFLPGRLSATPELAPRRVSSPGFYEAKWSERGWNVAGT